MVAMTIAMVLGRPDDAAELTSWGITSWETTIDGHRSGARLDAYYWMFGDHDGFVIVDAPDSASVAAISLAVSSTGAFAHLSTHELIEVGDVNAILARAKELTSSYTPPGA